jgi:hypothetical protein
MEKFFYYDATAYTVMEKPGFNCLLSEIPDYHVLSAPQQQNVRDLLRISEHFSRKAGLPIRQVRNVSSHSIILESGHQPNFLPYAGTWKKAFLLNHIHDYLVRNDRDTIAFFGLADQNISTARLLSKNQIPDLNKNGFLKIGFRIRNEDKLRSFNRIGKPVPEEFAKEIDRINKHYQKIREKTKFTDNIIEKEWDDLHELFWECYDRAENFADLNAILFARICHELNIVNVSFFLYSDMHHANLFLEESRNILRNAGRFNQIYNREISSRHLDIPRVTPDHIPFWYECVCGMKLDISCDTAGACEITCPACGHRYPVRFGPGFKDLEKYYENMDFNAVSRNIIMAHGLGVSLFISGTGGSSLYGQISESISSGLGFHRPVTLAWQSKEYYFGIMHKIAIWELMKTFSLSADDFFIGSVQEKIRLMFDSISAKIEKSNADGNEREKKHWTGVQNSAKNLVVYTQKLYSYTPSFIDILANYNHHTIVTMWEQGLYTAEFQKTGYVSRIIADTGYPVHFLHGRTPDDIGLLYDAVRNLGVR